jgi:putative SOS response-associated peptidase YedK
MTLTTDDYVAVADALGAVVDPADLAAARPRYNVAPTDPHPVVLVQGDERVLRWGLWGVTPRRQTKKGRAPLLINARAETVLERGLFRSAFLRNRCIVPADGFFEWTGPKNARRPIWYHAPGRGVLALAGLCLPSTDERTGEVSSHFLVLTTAANDLIAPVHDRMPAMLAGDAIDLWLRAMPADPDDRDAFAHTLLDRLAPAPADALVAERVSARVNDVRNDDAECLRPPDPELFPGA